MENGSNWKCVHTAALWVLIALILLTGWLLTPVSGIWAWILIAVFMGLVFIIVSMGVTGSASGLLIDTRNKMSLSRFQMTLWTLVVLSGYLAAAMANIFKSSRGDPLAIALDPQLWILMGISTASMVGSPLIKNTKEAKQPDEQQKTDTISLLSAKTGIAPDTRGLIVVNTKPEHASWSDMFSGEETGNAAFLDLAKVQMFFFTIILVLSYAVALGKMFYKMPNAITDLPALSAGMVTLLGISHAGYLTQKGIPHSQTS
ncbi:conserved membrane hypothetical protein [Syntrophobacter sp. SbD1]|nr:conserved membrane hypothetical protein [Syntrophobacter sp. SbD1]